MSIVKSSGELKCKMLHDTFPVTHSLRRKKEMNSAPTRGDIATPKAIAAIIYHLKYFTNIDLLSIFNNSIKL